MFCSRIYVDGEQMWGSGLGFVVGCGGFGNKRGGWIARLAFRTKKTAATRLRS